MINCFGQNQKLAQNQSEPVSDRGLTVDSVLYLDALLVQCILVEVEDGGLDGAGVGKDRQADVDGVASFGIQDDDFLPLAVHS